MKTLNHPFPDHHFDSLKELEKGYWWYEGRVFWAERFIKNWMKITGSLKTIHYADLGCGTGGLGKQIQKTFSFQKTILVDNNPAALKKINPGPDTELVKLDLETDFQLPFKPNLITCMDVIEHLKNDEAFLDTLMSQISPGGLLILSTAAHPVLFSNWDKALGHYRRYSKKSLINKLRKSGFKIQSVSYGWSFLAPAAPYRFLFSKQQENLQYPRVPKWMNQSLIRLSKWESKLSEFVNYPFGTSLFISALKEDKI
ncbi:MAG: class I SAM-dependent methyltransferase [Proteobacteria bacterium]|nr:class I SAM-dependent methyltransferase [Pseudomonadota bacterium]